LSPQEAERFALPFHLDKEDAEWAVLIAPFHSEFDLAEEGMLPLDFTSEQVVAKMRPLEFIDSYRAPQPPRSGRELFIGGCEFVIGSLYVHRDRVGRLSYPDRPFAPPYGRASFDLD
jgi:hypothetical protein